MIKQQERTNLKVLADGLVAFGVDRADSLLIMAMMVGETQKTKELIYWMTNHPSATPNEIFNYAQKISEAKPQES